MLWGYKTFRALHSGVESRVGVEWPRWKCGKSWIIHECPEVICSTSTTLAYILLQILRVQSQLPNNVSSLPKTSQGHPRLQNSAHSSEILQNLLRGASPVVGPFKLSTLDPESRRLWGSEAQARVWNLRCRSSPLAIGYLANFISSGITVGTQKSPRRFQISLQLRTQVSKQAMTRSLLFQKGNMFDKQKKMQTGQLRTHLCNHVAEWSKLRHCSPENIATLVNPSH